MPARFRVRWNTAQFALACDRLLESCPRLERASVEAMLRTVKDVLIHMADNDMLFPEIAGGRRAYRRVATASAPTVVIEYAIDDDLVFGLAITAPNGDDRS